jgi:hypothetical protein
MKHLPVLLALLPAAALAQPMPYQDADNPSQAVGMMQSTVVANRKMLSECSTRFPDAADRYRGQLKAWEETEHADIRKAQYFFDRMASKEPRLNEMLAFAETVVVRNLETLSNAPPSLSGTMGSVLAEYCASYFANLAGGVWRTRTPRMYRYLDAAPNIP